MLITGIIWEHSWDHHWKREGKVEGLVKRSLNVIHSQRKPSLIQWGTLELEWTSELFHIEVKGRVSKRLVDIHSFIHLLLFKYIFH